MDKVKALEQLAVRLSHMADGVDQEVDALLVAVRKLLKEGGDAGKIETLSGRLARTMMANTGVNPDKGRTIEGGYDLSGLRKLIKTMPVRGDEQERMGLLVQQIASGTTSIARQKALVDLLGAAAEALREVATRDKSDSGVLGWLGKKSSAEGGDDRYVALFVQLLQRLVEHIDVLNGNLNRSTSIKEALQQATNPEQAQKLLSEVTDEIETIDARIRSERNQTTDFLGDLRERLDGFEEVLNFLADDGDSSLKRSEDLQNSVDEDTREIGEAAKSDDIDEIRSVVATGLMRLTERLATHVMSERAQNDVSRARVAELNDRLAHLEGEADMLRSEIRNKNDLALKDALTGVYNRAGYEERTKELYARWQRSGSPLSIVFVDCNKFKEINDTYGHTAGDLVLIKVSDVLQLRARASDIVCRYGGDEFVILLPDTRIQGAEVFARSACDEVLNAGFNDNGKPLDVSISCGVTELVKGDTLESAVGRADEAMYQAK
ncbi:MAG: diguanylate cyclase, partial [Congregibacter sp.]|nr:diguanylate cyclase [Congregibacter sp.]